MWIRNLLLTSLVVLSCHFHVGPVVARSADLPFRCFPEVWAKSFKVSKPTYDKATGMLSWKLEVREDMTLPRYEAYLADGDGVEQGTVAIKVEPARPSYKAGAKLEATLSFRGIEVGNIVTLTIREKR